MKQTGWRLRGIAAGVCLYAFAAPAFAQDKPAPAAPASPKPAKDAKDSAAAVKTVDTWESTQAEPETLEETFFKLSRDFVTTSDDGFRRLGSVPIWPRGEMKIGGFRILPYLREAAEFEDNFYRQASTGDSSRDHDRRTQWTHVNELGALADTALMGGRLKISASADSIWNVRYTDDQPDTWDFDGQAGATYTWPSGIWLSGGIAFTRRHDPADQPLLAEDFGRTDRRTFFTMGMDRDIFFHSKAKFEIGIQTRNSQSQDKAYDDMNRDENTAWAKVSYPFWKDTTRLFLLGKYRLDNRQSDSINDGKTFGMNVGMEGSIPLREGEYRSLKGQVSVGFEDSLYSNDKFTRGSDTITADSNRTSTQLNVQAGLQYIMSPRSSADLRYLHGTEFSFYGNYQVVDRLDLAFSHNFTRALVGRVSTFFEHTSPSGNEPAQTTPPSDYSNDAPNVTRLGVGAGLRYAYNEWMDIDLSADVENRNDHTDKTYRNYRGVLGVTFYLNALRPKGRAAER